MEPSPVSIEIPANWSRRFFTLWSGLSISQIGSALIQFALIWWLTKTTGSATVLAVSTLAALLPGIFLAPFAGTLVDRWNRRAVVMTVRGLASLSEAILVLLFGSGRIAVWEVLVILFLLAAAATFSSPAIQASTPLMVPRDQLARIAGLNYTLSGILGVVAPPLGAVLINAFPIHWVLAIDVIAGSLALAVFAAVDIPQPPHSPARAGGIFKRSSYWQDLKAGWTYLVGWPGLLGICLLAMAGNALSYPLESLIPLLVTKVYRGGALQLGWMNSGIKLGLILGGLAISAWGGFKKRVLTFLLTSMLTGLSFVLMGVLPSTWFFGALICVTLFGTMVTMGNAPIDALLQSTVAPELQARVLGLINAGATAMTPLCLLLAGPVADRLGMRAMYAVCGGIDVVIISIGLGIPAIMNLETNAHPVRPLGPP